MKAIFVVDLGFGDAGKGSIVDFLTRENKNSLVVKYNGGPQCGHNVVSERGIQHTFSQVGSGYFNSKHTYISKYTLVEPVSMVRELTALKRTGYRNVISIINPNAKIITPYHIMANRYKLSLSKKNNSCGMGINECIRDFLDKDLYITIENICKGDFFYSLKRMRQIRLDELNIDLVESVEKVYDIIKKALSSNLFYYSDESFIPNNDYEETIFVFESGQGVLLDQWYGFHPYTTWSNITFDNAYDICNKIGIKDIIKIGVIRTYQVRHGDGPFPTESVALDRLPEPHNFDTGYQGKLKRGYLDLNLLKYSIDVLGGIDYIALNHCDYLHSSDKVCIGYKNFDLKKNLLPTTDPNFLIEQEKITNALFKAEPIYKETSNMIKEIEEFTEVPVKLIGVGPNIKQWRNNNG